MREISGTIVKDGITEEDYWNLKKSICKFIDKSKMITLVNFKNQKVKEYLTPGSFIEFVIEDHTDFFNEIKQFDFINNIEFQNHAENQRRRVTNLMCKEVFKREYLNAGFEIMDNKKYNIKIKSRGTKQVNNKFRWWQIRPPKKEIQLAENQGINKKDAWMVSIRNFNYHALVSLRYEEIWVFNTPELEELIQINKIHYDDKRKVK